MKPVALFWFRRDLRLHDNVGLEAALRSGLPVLPLFIFDTQILSKLEDRDDRRVEFIHARVTELDREMREYGSALRVEHGRPEDIFKELFKKFGIKEIYLNHDYEPSAVQRDSHIRKLARAHGAEVFTFKDQVIFEKLEVEKGGGGSYSVFTPYSRKWRGNLKPEMLKTHASEQNLKELLRSAAHRIPPLESLGFRPGGLPFPPADVEKSLVEKYADTRNIPSIPGTSRLGLHLRFGTVSIRDLVKKAEKWSDTWLTELIWREFFMQILWHHPNVVSAPFRSEYSKIQYLNGEKEFAAWCEGRTGYPMVDAGMRELNETGFMHNRVRMVTASFLVKHLLVDWRWGERYFARRLLDYELSSNNGNWQWAAGCGCDAAPYFRVFNPLEQQKKFDRDLAYVKTWVPEVGTDAYPAPLVDHKFARNRVLKVYKKGLYGSS